MTYPYDNDNMKYDYTMHKYVLQPTAVSTQLGYDLAVVLNPTGDNNPSTMGERFLKQVTNHLYNWIYSHNLRYKPFVEKALAQYSECRPIIEQCLLNEVEFTLKNGQFWDIIDINTNHRQVSFDTEILLNSTLPSGLNLLYQGVYKVSIGELDTGDVY